MGKISGFLIAMMVSACALAPVGAQDRPPVSSDDSGNTRLQIIHFDQGAICDTVEHVTGLVKSMQDTDDFSSVDHPGCYLGEWGFVIQDELQKMTDAHGNPWAIYTLRIMGTGSPDKFMPVNPFTAYAAFIEPGQNL